MAESSCAAAAHDPSACACSQSPGVDFKFAFQPIIDLRTSKIFAHEALVRGPAGEGADTVLSQVHEDNLHAFDRKCRIGAVKAASRLMKSDSGLLSLNTMPNSVYDPKTCLLTTIAAAEAVDFPVNRIMFEMTEHEAIKDLDHFTEIVTSYKEMGFITAIDDFGAGSSGLTLFASVMPDIVKLDARLCVGIHKSRVQKILVGNIVEMCDKFGIRVIAEGVETCEEVTTMRDLGVTLFQGHHFAKPAFEGVIAEADIPWDSVRC